jgi:hypothetical protein
VADAKARLHDGEAFLAVTTMSEEPDVIATNAIHAAIAAADAICCVALRVRPSDGNHAAPCSSSALSIRGSAPR